MKRVEDRPSSALLALYRILVGIVLALALVLAVGTAYGFIRRGPGPQRAETFPAENEVSGGENIFSGLGTLRVSSGGENPETVIVTIAFPYNGGDLPYAEELVSRIPDFKNEVAGYFGSLSAEELRAAEVEEINRTLLGRFNGLLRLGQIRELFFIDYIWL
ncbi:MAG: flagellar basal body protein FliL [Treponema sp.]|jgi:flagellar basal body-associated protein FliL|nr:flagellar basal body protein FliL [Treponema sp.]